MHNDKKWDECDKKIYDKKKRIEWGRLLPVVCHMVLLLDANQFIVNDAVIISIVFSFSKKQLEKTQELQKPFQNQESPNESYILWFFH